MNGTRTVVRKILAIHYYRIEKAIIHNLEVLVVPNAPKFPLHKGDAQGCFHLPELLEIGVGMCVMHKSGGTGGGGVQVPIKPLPIHLTP